MENIDDGSLVDPYRIIYKVYALTDENHCITDIWSTGNQALGDKRTIEEMQELGYVQIDEGANGQIYGHAQPNYLKMKYGKTMYDEQMRCNYKYIDKVIELSEEEKETFFPPVEPQPTKQEQFNAMILIELAKIKAGV